MSRLELTVGEKLVLQAAQRCTNGCTPDELMRNAGFKWRDNLVRHAGNLAKLGLLKQSDGKFLAAERTNLVRRMAA
jgi:hypothetical protein